MPINPTHPAPHIAEPGKQRPEDETRQPGHARPSRDADANPLNEPPHRRDPLGSPLEDDDPLAPPL